MSGCHNFQMILKNIYLCLAELYQTGSMNDCVEKFPYPLLTSDGDCSRILHIYLLHICVCVCVCVYVYVGFIYYCRHRTL